MLGMTILVLIAQKAYATLQQPSPYLNFLGRPRVSALIALGNRMSQPPLDYTHHLINVYRRRLQKLLDRQEALGARAPMYISIEVEDIKRIITLLENPDQARPAASISENLRFQNQIEALNAVLGQNQIGNFIIEAPAGYGKTYLLEELKLRLIHEGWYVQMISLRHADIPPNSQHDALAYISDVLGNHDQSDMLGAGFTAANMLRGLSTDTTTKLASRGAFLLLDSAEFLFKNRIETPYSNIKDFFVGINQASAEFENFKVRVIIAGRYIVDDRLLAINAPSIRLQVFNLNVVQQAIDTFLSDRATKRTYTWTESFAKHVLYLTGGHPLMIKQLLMREFDYYMQTPNLDTWLVNATERIKNNIIVPVITEIRKDIPDGDTLWGDLLRLSIFRRFNKPIIRLLFPNLQEKPYEYTDRLERYSLVIREESFYKDGVLQPAMVRWLQTTAYDDLKQYCQEARSIFTHQLINPSIEGFRAPAIVRELLYIHLLELHRIAIYAPHSSIEQENRQLKTTMLNYIDILRQQDRMYDLEELMHDVRSALLSDNELFFLYDYIFRRRATSPEDPPDYAMFVHSVCGNQQAASS